MFRVLPNAAILLGAVVSMYAIGTKPAPDTMLLNAEGPIIDQVEYGTSLSEEEYRLIMENLLQKEDDIQQYAYMDFESADESLRKVILAARRKIIFRQGWVADEIDGYIFDKNGNLIEELPHFSDLFPEDWDVPVTPTEVDLSYYGRS